MSSIHQAINGCGDLYADPMAFVATSANEPDDPLLQVI
jgi:hypothetical protein